MMKLISLILYVWLFFLITNLLIKGFLWLLRWRLTSRMSSSKRHASRSPRDRSDQSNTIIDAEFREIE